MFKYNVEYVRIEIFYILIFLPYLFGIFPDSVQVNLAFFTCGHSIIYKARPTQNCAGLKNTDLFKDAYYSQARDKMASAIMQASSKRLSSGMNSST